METVRQIWKRGIVEDQRDYDRMVSELRKVIATHGESNEALTAQFIIGRIELNRAETEALASFSKVREVLEPLATKHPKAWQGQAARIVLLHILELEEQSRQVISAAQKALGEIDWELLGKSAPPDLAEFKKMSDTKSELTPDFLRSLIAKSYLKLNEPKEAKRWLSQIEDVEIRREIEQMLKSN